MCCWFWNIVFDRTLTRTTWRNTDIIFPCVIWRLHPTVTLATIASSNNGECPKCGAAKKSGRSSCCAPGGAWFKNCGDAGDTTFNHTWAEGVHACKGVGSSVSAEKPQQLVLDHIEGIIPYELHYIRTQNIAQHQRNARSSSNADTTCFQDYVGPTRTVFFICVSFIVLLL